VLVGPTIQRLPSPVTYSFGQSNNPTDRIIGGAGW